MNAFIAVVVILALALSCQARTDSEYKDAFVDYVQQFQKVYSSGDFTKRFEAFKYNLDYVEAWNAEQNGVTLEMNAFADLTNDEFKQNYLGVVFDYESYVPVNEFVPEVSVADLPTSVDWRTKGAVTPIKNQGQCGSCWSFSTTGSTEGAWNISGHALVGLSEQNLMDCSTAEGNQGCNGGLMDDAFKYIIKNNGIDSEASYPYQTAQGPKCLYTTANKAATISKYVDVASKNETALQVASANVGPISVAIDASHESFQLYKTGVYHQLLCSQTRLDHGVLVVGYGTDATSGNDYWIVKNSWGTTWGQDGYIWMSRNKNNNCGIATSASYPIV